MAVSTVALAALALTVSAESVRVRGRVTGSDASPVAKAKVRLEDTTRSRVYRQKTNKSGEFQLRGVAPSTYTLTVDKEGYAGHVVEQVAVAAEDRELVIVLQSVEERQATLRRQRIAEGDSYLAGYDSYERGDYAGAVESAEKLIVARPDDPRGYDLKAKALVRQRRYAAAIPLLEKTLALSQAPATESLLASVYFNAGVVASREHKTAEAIGYWEASLEHGDADPAVERLIGGGYLQLQDFVQAGRHLQAYLEKDPDADDGDEVRALLEAIRELEVTR